MTVMAKIFRDMYELVTEASGTVCGHEKKDGLLQNQITFCKLMKDFVSKIYFNGLSN